MQNDRAVGVYNGVFTKDSDVYKKLQNKPYRVDVTHRLNCFELLQAELWDDTDLIFEADWVYYECFPNGQSKYKDEARKKFEEKQQ